MTYNIGNFVADFEYLQSFADRPNKAQLSNWSAKYIKGKFAPTERTITIVPDNSVPAGPQRQIRQRRQVYDEFAILLSRYSVLAQNNIALQAAKPDLIRCATGLSQSITKN